MWHSRTSLIVMIGLLLLAVVSTYYVTGYQAARSQAVSVALGGSMPGPGLADSSWSVALGQPSITQLVVSLAGLPRSNPLTSLTFSFILSNGADSRVPALPVFVKVDLTLHGWTVIGNGIEG